MNEPLGKWRFIVDTARGGAQNMALDEAVALCGGSQIPGATLRVYRFDPPAVTLGRFQNLEETVDPAACAREGIDLARRATGGLAILHLEDFTYSVVMRGEEERAPTRKECFDTVARGILAALETLGVEASQVEHTRSGTRNGGWCLEGILGVDLEWNGRKICGSAQRVFGGAVLQHGSLFLEETGETMERISGSVRDGAPEGARFAALNEAAGRAVSWEEVSQAFREGFQMALGLTLEPGRLSPAELEMASRLARDKYEAEEWTAGRGPESRGGGL